MECHSLICATWDGQCRERRLTGKAALQTTGSLRLQRAEPHVLYGLGEVSVLQAVNGILSAWFYTGATVPPCPLAGVNSGPGNQALLLSPDERMSRGF